MKMIRSFIFGGFAMLAAVLCMSAPAAAVSYEPPGYTVEVYSFDFVALDVFKVDVNQLVVSDLPDRSSNSHAVAYKVQNQPNSLFRQNVEAYSHIDPHIGLYV